MANNRFNKQVTPKGYQKGGSVKKSEHPLAGRQGNLLHRLKSQKQIKAITDTKKYKDASYNEKQKMLDAGGAYTKSAPDQKSRTSRKMGGRIRKMGGGSLKAVPADNKGLKKLPTEVRNKMGFMKKGGVVSDTKKKQFKANQAGQKSFNKKAMKVAKTIGKIVIPGGMAVDTGVKLAKKFKGDK